MVTNRPQGNLVGWRINKKHFRLGKNIEISSLDKYPILLMPAVGFEPTTFQSLNGSVTPRLARHLNHSATEDWLTLSECYDVRLNLHCTTSLIRASELVPSLFLA